MIPWRTFTKIVNLLQDSQYVRELGIAEVLLLLEDLREAARTERQEALRLLEALASQL